MKAMNNGEIPFDSRRYMELSTQQIGVAKMLGEVGE